MQIIKSLVISLVFVCPFLTKAQTTFLPIGDKGYHFVDRMEIKQQTNTNFNFSGLRPYSRKAIVKQTEFLDSARMGYRDSITGIDMYKEWTDLELTKIDEYNLRSFLMNNSEWVSGSKDDFKSTKPFLIKSLYKTKPNLLEVNNKDLFLVLNPVLQIHQAIEPGLSKTIFLNSRGLTVRGRIANKIGFSSTFTDNQERGPVFFGNYVFDPTRKATGGGIYKAVPGVGFFKDFKNDRTSFDYLDARGYITFNAAKFVDVQFGYDKNFIGNGYRSLFLSDWGNSNLFLKLNTKIWKFNYQNLFMELMPQFTKTTDDLLSRKYAAMHHLSINVSRWLNIGLFESVIFGRKDHFDFSYLNPIIFLRHIEGTNGSADNALAGIDFKANVAHRLQFYGQFLLDEFKLDKIKENKGWWANKWGLQLGAKYIDAFGVPNLDIQFESNRVRPYTYSHSSIISNYTHYNQPLAHPLGANFQEFVGIANYQPGPRWYISGRVIYYKQGLDSLNGTNFGASPLKSNRREGDVDGTRKYEDGYKLGDGRKVTCMNGLFQVSYEWKENLFLDLSLLYRNYKIANTTGSSNTTLITAGLRLNISKREYDF